MSISKRAATILCSVMCMVLQLFSSSQTAIATPVDDLQPGHWYEVPNSSLAQFAPSTSPAGYLSNIMKAWSGGAYDTKRDRLIVWGGGHGDYAGNEIYVFDVNTLKWSRITDPSDWLGGDEASGVYLDGLPRSRHTYNYIEYMPNIDRFVSVGSAATYPNGMSPDKKFYDFNFDTLTWNKSRAPAISGGNISSFAVYDPVTGHLFRHGALNTYFGLDEYDPVNDKWTKRPGGYVRLYVTAAIDPVRRTLVTIGNGTTPLRWDLSNASAAPVKFTTSGDKSIESATAPGFVFDPASQRYVGWSGGADVFVLDPTNWTWTRIKPAATNTVIPTQVPKWGTYGRFRYIPSKNVFIVVNETTGNVYFYKLTKNGAGTWPNVSFDTTGSKTVKAGSSITLTWNVTNANDCTASGGWSGNKGVTGTETVGPINNDTIFTLTCKGSTGTSSSAVSISVDGDVLPPEVSKISTGGDASSITIEFNEIVSTTPANTAANYSFSPVLSVNSATLQRDGKRVVLSTSAMTKDVTYTLQVNNITDTSEAANLIDGSKKYTFTYAGGSASGAVPSNYVWGTLDDGKTVYIDRDYTFVNVTSKYQGMDYLQTANNDKNTSGASFVSFSVAKDTTVYVGYDRRNVPIPSWLKSWTATGDVIEATHEKFNIYKKSFSAGSVTIDGNELGNSMYTVIVENADANSSASSSSPTNNPNSPVTSSSPSASTPTLDEGDSSSSPTASNPGSDGAEGGAGAFTLHFLILMFVFYFISVANKKKLDLSQEG